MATCTRLVVSNGSVNFSMADPKAQCYSFDIQGHRFRNKKPQVHHIVSDITYDIIPNIILGFMPDISDTLFSAGFCVSCRPTPFQERAIG